MELKHQTAVESDDEAAAVLRDATEEGLEAGLTGVSFPRFLQLRRAFIVFCACFSPPQSVNVIKLLVSIKPGHALMISERK
jgi:hypothetical protein